MLFMEAHVVQYRIPFVRLRREKQLRLEQMETEQENMEEEEPTTEDEPPPRQRKR